MGSNPENSSAATVVCPRCHHRPENHLATAACPCNCHRRREIGPKLSILLHTSDYRGDHDADICQPFSPVAGETVDELVTRTKLGENPRSIGDRLEIRVIK